MDGAINHSERSHALLSASGAKRWLNCTPSARLTEHLPDETSEYAEGGEVAHELSEVKLTRKLIPNNAAARADLDEKHKTIKAHALYDSEMEHATDEYVDYVVDRYYAAKARDDAALVALEQRVDYSEWVPEGQGTADVTIIGGDTIEVIDLKYGKGIPVSAIGNPQIRLYALGALVRFSLPHRNDCHLKNVRMTIVQPRLDSITTEEMTVEDLLAWADSIVETAMRAWRGEGDFVPGEWCRFCGAKATCRARADFHLDAVRYAYKEPPLLSLDEIGTILHIANSLNAWASNVRDYALEQALTGREVPGWKLVEGTARRKYRDPVKIMETLSVMFDEDEYLKPRELLAMTQLESKIGKKEFKSLLGDMVSKPTGAPTLAEEVDPRPPFRSVENDFANEEF